MTSQRASYCRKGVERASESPETSQAVDRLYPGLW